MTFTKIAAMALIMVTLVASNQVYRPAKYADEEGTTLGKKVYTTKIDPALQKKCLGFYKTLNKERKFFHNV